MSELEPVVTVLHPDRDGNRVSLIDLNKFHALPVGAELYIIPDTHRVVSVELLQSYQAAIEAGQFMGFDDEYEQMQAIIDNKEQKE